MYSNDLPNNIQKNIQNMYLSKHKFYVTVMWLEENQEKES